MEQVVLCEFEVNLTFLASSRTSQGYIVRLYLKTDIDLEKAPRIYP